MTADEPRVRVNTNLAFGICLILLGAVLILDRLQLANAGELLMRYWPVALMLFGAALVIQSFQRVEPVEARQNFNAGNIFALVIFSILISQAFSRGVTSRTETAETIDVVAVMSRHERVSAGPVFRRGEVTSIWGRADLDLRNTSVAPGEEAVVEVFTLMGGTTIRVPDGWIIDLRATPVMGGVRDRRTGTRDAPGAPRLVIRGFIMMGGLSIRS